MNVRTLARVFLGLTTMAVAGNAQAQFSFTTNNGAITITKYSGSGTAVIIPSTISGLPVTTIGGGAFTGSGLKNVIIPDSVTAIGSDAFWGASLTNVSLGNSVASIGDYAFSHCGSLTSIVFPKSVISIGFGLFDATYLRGIYCEGNAPSLNGAFFAERNTIIYYLPGTIGWGNLSAVTGLQTMQWLLPDVPNIAPGFKVQGRRVYLPIFWATNRSVVVEYCTNLTQPVWQPVSTNTLFNGAASYNDFLVTNSPDCFYRLRSP